MTNPDFYNITLVCTYKSIDEEFSNDLYQVQFLQAFNLSAWNDSTISQSIDKIYDEFSKLKDFRDIFETLKVQNNLASVIGFIGDDDETVFRLLFGYEYFSEMHKCICDYYSIGKASNDSIKNLLKCINDY